MADGLLGAALANARTAPSAVAEVADGVGDMKSKAGGTSESGAIMPDRATIGGGGSGVDRVSEGWAANPGNAKIGVAVTAETSECGDMGEPMEPMEVCDGGVVWWVGVVASNVARVACGGINTMVLADPCNAFDSAVSGSNKLVKSRCWGWLGLGIRPAIRDDGALDECGPSSLVSSVGSGDGAIEASRGGGRSKSRSLLALVLMIHKHHHKIQRENILPHTHTHKHKEKHTCTHPHVGTRTTEMEQYPLSPLAAVESKSTQSACWSRDAMSDT